MLRKSTLTFMESRIILSKLGKFQSLKVIRETLNSFDSLDHTGAGENLCPL